MERQKKAQKAVYVSIFGNLGLAIIKGLTGIFGNSFALIADAIESTSDVFASILVLFGIKYASRPPDENHPYGHGRAEPLITFMIVGFLLISATIITFQSIINITTEHESPEAFTLWILGGIIISKEIFYRFVSKRGKETDSTSLKADAWHHRSDALTSLAAFIGILVAVIMGEGYEEADDWAALFAVIIIVINAFLIFRPALGEVMDEHMHDELELEIRNISKKVKGVKDTEKCFIRKTGMTFHVDLHALVDRNISVEEGHEISHRLKDRLMEEKPEIENVLIHIEPI